MGVLKGQEGKLEEDSLACPMTWLMVVLQDQIDTILLSASTDSRGVSRFCSEMVPRLNESILIDNHPPYPASQVRWRAYPGESHRFSNRDCTWTWVSSFKEGRNVFLPDVVQILWICPRRMRDGK